MPVLTLRFIGTQIRRETWWDEGVADTPSAIAIEEFVISWPPYGRTGSNTTGALISLSKKNGGSRMSRRSKTLARAY